jgi:DNA-directed RNA polymerase subunit L
MVLFSRNLFKPTGFQANMELNFLEDKKEEVVLELHGVSHGFCNVLKEELVKDKTVKLATYRVDHPLVGVPKMKIEGTNPRASLKKALKSLESTADEFKKESKKIK